MSLRHILLRALVAMAILASVLSAVAGRWDLPLFWAYLGVVFGGGLVGLAVVLPRNPGVIRDRIRPGPGGKDPSTRWAAMVFALACLVLAALGVGRFHWSGRIPFAVQLAALLVVGVTLGVWMWAMVVNPFFSSEVRIQRERGHRVISDSPYRFVRHPGYAVVIVFFLATPLALGSWWALLPMAPVVLLFLRRTALEDRLLCAELAGYEFYVQRVRFRLLPGIW